MKITQKITPHLWYNKEAKEAGSFYVSIFPKSKIKSISTIHNTPSGDVDAVVFELCGQEFMALSAGPMFKFNESISFIVHCENQKEVDYYWDNLSADPKAEQCGWLKDKFGLSWHIIPTVLDKFMSIKDKNKLARVTEAFLKMKKLDIAALELAYRG